MNQNNPSLKELKENSFSAQKIWEKTPYSEKLQVMEGLLEKLETADSQRLSTREDKKQLKWVVEMIEFYLDSTDEVLSTKKEVDTPNLEIIQDFVPLKYIFLVSTWSDFFYDDLKLIIPALLSSNSLIYRPALDAIETANEMILLLESCGLPTKLIQIVKDFDASDFQTTHQCFYNGDCQSWKNQKNQKFHFSFTAGQNIAYITESCRGLNQMVPKILEWSLPFKAGSSLAINKILIHQTVWEEFLVAFKGALNHIKPENFKLTSEPKFSNEEDSSRVETIDVKIDHHFEKSIIFYKISETGIPKNPTLLSSKLHIIHIPNDELAQQVIQRQNDLTGVAVFCQDKKKAFHLIRPLEANIISLNNWDRIPPNIKISSTAINSTGFVQSKSSLENFVKSKIYQL